MALNPLIAGVLYHQSSLRDLVLGLGYGLGRRQG